MTAAEERAYVLQTFQECMTPYKDKKIALYGLGVNSEHLVLHQEGYQIEALLDGKRVGEICFGLPVISAEEAIQQIDVIVIVAKNESVPIIYDRIAWMEEKGIVITDISGRTIVDKTDEELKKESYWEKDYEHLIREIDKHEVITFDIFDTLLMRSVLKPEDIFEVVAKQWCWKNQESYSVVATMVEHRKQAQKRAKEKYDAYCYAQIFELLKQIGSYTDKQIEDLKKLEFETEKQFLVPRYDVVNALKYAYESGKRVYLISDMYFRDADIKEILDKYEITQYHGLLISSDAGCWKWPDAELFKTAIEKFDLADKKVLHIGDNEGADWICGEKAGFKVYPIWSAYHMLEKSALKYLLVNVKTVEDSCMLGIYASKYLNSPFALHEGRGKLVLKSVYDVGYAGYGALLTAYTHYLIQTYQGQDKAKVLFLARDGYLPQKLYDRIVREHQIKDAAPSVYVLASRRALAVPAILNDEELEYQIGRSNTEVECGEFLKMRFGVSPAEDDQEAACTMQGEKLQDYLRKYKKDILLNAEKERKSYLSYLESLDIDLINEKHILMDSATCGTAAFYWRKLVQSEAEMEAILLVDITDWSLYDERYDRGFLGKDSKLLERKAYYRSEFLNDSILTAPESQMLFIKEHKPVFSDKEQNRNFDKISLAQEGIADFCKDYLGKMSYPVSMQCFDREFLDKFIFTLIEKCVVSDDVKKDFMVVEQFSGRTGEIRAWK